MLTFAPFPFFLLERFQLAEKNQLSRIADLETQVEAKEATSASVDASVGNAFGEISLELEKEKEEKVRLAKTLEIEQGQKKNLTRRIKGDILHKLHCAESAPKVIRFLTVRVEEASKGPSVVMKQQSAA